MSGHRVSWPEEADGHETNVIGEPSRLLPVARSAPLLSSLSLLLSLSLSAPSIPLLGLGDPRASAVGFSPQRISRCTMFQIWTEGGDLEEEPRHLKDGRRSKGEVPRPELSLKPSSGTKRSRLSCTCSEAAACFRETGRRKEIHGGGARKIREKNHTRYRGCDRNSQGVRRM